MSDSKQPNTSGLAEQASAAQIRIGKYLERRRVWKGENQSTAARNMGVGPMTIVRIERGDNVRLDLFLQYLIHLDCASKILGEFNPEDYGYETKRYYPSDRAKPTQTEPSQV